MSLNLFLQVLLFSLSVVTSTMLAVRSTVDYWRETNQLTHYEALCAARGGTAVPTDDGDIACLICDGSQP